MLRITAIVALAAVALAPGVSLAGMSERDLDAAFGEAEVAWAEPVQDEELGGLRGGAGVLFSGFFESTLQNNSSATLPDGVTVSELGPNQAQITAGIGSFGNFRGVLQTANVRGNFNTVRNVLNLNVTINPPANMVPGILN